MSATYNTSASQFNFRAFYNLLAYLYIGGFVVVGIIYGLSPIVYTAFVLMAIIFILPSPILGVHLAIVMTMIFERWFTLQPIITEYAVYKIYPLDIVIIASILGIILHHLFQEKKKINISTPEILLFIFIIINSIYLIKSFYDINSDLAVAFSTFKNYAYYPLLYFIILLTIQTRKQFENTIHLILLTGIGIIGFIAIGLVQGHGLWTEFTPLSTEGTRFLAGTHAYYLVITSLIAVSLLAYDRFRNKGLASIIITIWLLGITVSLMRHLWIAWLVGIGILITLIPYSHKKRLINISFKSGLVILAIIMTMFLTVNVLPLSKMSDTFNKSINVISQRTTSLNTQDTSVNWRINFWQEAKNIWLESPILGIGFGHKLTLEVGEWQTQEEIRNIHNSPLAITIQMGLIGIGIFSLFVITSILHSVKWIINNEDLKPYYLGLIAVLSAIAVASLFQPYFETNLTGIFFWIGLGLLRTSQFLSEEQN